MYRLTKVFSFKTFFMTMVIYNNGNQTIYFIYIYIYIHIYIHVYVIKTSEIFITTADREADMENLSPDRDQNHLEL